MLSRVPANLNLTVNRNSVLELVLNEDRALHIPGTLGGPFGGLDHQTQYVRLLIGAKIRATDFYYAHAYSFLPIVILALVFNITNAVGFTYA